MLRWEMWQGVVFRRVLAVVGVFQARPPHTGMRYKEVSRP